MHGFGPVFWATASRQPGQVSVWSSSQVVLSVVLLLVLVLSAMAQEDGQKVSVRVARVGAVNGRAEQLNGVERRMKVELFSLLRPARRGITVQSDAYNSPTVLYQALYQALFHAHRRVNWSGEACPVVWSGEVIRQSGAT